MTIQEICLREELAMGMRRICGVDQQDDHVWRWLNYHLDIWSRANPVRIFKDD